MDGAKKNFTKKVDACGRNLNNSASRFTAPVSQGIDGGRDETFFSVRP